MISVALAAYNGEKFIEKQLESLRDQTLPPDEVIICDDRSTDKTVEICRAFIEKNKLSGWKIEINAENLGYCRNFYKAIEKTNGDLIFLCDQDDEWDGNKLAVMAEIMEKHPQLRMLSCRYRLINGAGAPAAGVRVPHYEPLFDGKLQTVTAESLIGHSYIRGCSSCFKSELKQLLKPIDLSGLLGHDWLLAMLAALNGGAAIINIPLMSYRCHGGNASFSASPVRLKEKRIEGLKQSVEGHKAILKLENDKVLRRKTERFISFERQRIRFLENKNPFLWLALGLRIRQYRRYYAGNGVRVWFGDMVYAHK